MSIRDTDLTALCQVSVPSIHGPRHLVLRVPRFGDISGLLHEPDVPRDERRLANWLPAIPLLFLDQLDGTEFLYDRLDPLLGDAELVRGLLARIRDLLDTLRERGRVFVTCPACKAWETETSFTAYALTIATPLPSTFDGPFFTIPTLGLPVHAPPRRPPIPAAHQIRFELPSSVLGMSRAFRGGALGQVGYVEDEDDPPRPIDDDDDDETPLTEESPLVWGHVGWRAAARLAQAIQPNVSTDVLGRMPAYDFFFLELLHYVTAVAPVKADTAGKITCGSCGAVFLPIAPAWSAKR